MHVEAMLAAHPDADEGTNVALLRCVEACLDCVQACTSCADACLAEPGVDGLRRCIRLDLDCADMCAAAAAIASRRTAGDPRAVAAALEACATLCGLCAEECERHAGMHAHCRICAEACRQCEAACRDAVGGIG